MSDRPVLHEALIRFASTLAGSYDVVEMLAEVSETARLVTGAHGAGVSLADPDGLLRFVAATDETIRVIEQAQESSGSGPCHDAYRTGQPVLVPDLAAATSWPEFRPVPLANGMHAVAGIPMVIDSRSIGALNLYDDRPREWTDEEIDATLVLAHVSTSYVVYARLLEQREIVVEQLQHALDSRVVIEQAKGILAGELGIPVSDALTVLRDHARRTSTKLQDVATAVVQLGLRPPTPGDRSGG